MASVQKNDIGESPLQDFARDCWLGCVSEIKTDSLGQEDFLLFIAWGLDTIKRESEKDDKRYRTIVYDALRNWLRDEGEELESETINLLTNLICACCLSCFGLALTDSMGNRDVYEDLMASMVEQRDEVRKIKARITSEIAPELKEWVLAYLDSDVLYTKRDSIEWVGAKKKRTAKKDEVKEDEPEEGKKARKRNPNAPIHLSDDFAKMDMLRVVAALYKIGAFVSPDGKRLTQKKVFETFGEMVGEDFSGYSRNFVSTDYNSGEVKIFERLEAAFKKFDMDRGKRGKK